MTLSLQERDDDGQFVEHLPMPEKRMSICSVCQQERSTTVACSVLGPFSSAYCHDCLINDAEPLDLWHSTFDVLGSVDVRDDLKLFGSYKDGRYITYAEIVACYYPTEF